jgi:antitoxin FitA
MATITIKNIPETVYQRLKRQAAQSRRSLNQQVIACLEQSTGSVPLDPAAFLARARGIRKPTKGPSLTEKRLKEFKIAGRL